MKHAGNKRSCTFLSVIRFSFLQGTKNWKPNLHIFPSLDCLATKPVPWLTALSSHSNAYRLQRDRVSQEQKLMAGSTKNTWLLPLADLLGICRCKIFIELCLSCIILLSIWRRVFLFCLSVVMRWSWTMCEIPRYNDNLNSIIRYTGVNLYISWYGKYQLVMTSFFHATH